MVAILTTKKTKPIVVNQVIISSYAAFVRRNFAADLFAEKYDNRTQSNLIEHNRKAIERNRIFQSFLFSIGIRLIPLIEFQSFDYVRLFSINSIIEILD